MSGVAGTPVMLSPRAASQGVASPSAIPISTAFTGTFCTAASSADSYRLLEADGVVTTNGRRGTVVASSALGDRDAVALATEYVDRARRRGLTLAEATRLVEKAWPR